MNKKVISFILIAVVLTVFYVPSVFSVSNFDRLLRMGSRGSDVAEIQKRLTELGYKVGSDGIFGRTTHNQVVKFQRANGLSGDGIVGKNTINKLYGTQSSEPNPTPPSSSIPISSLLRKGSRGSEVVALQKRLTELGYKVGSDGIFGRTTHNQVIKFQIANGLSGDGIVGKNTINKLYSGQSIEPTPTPEDKLIEEEKTPIISKSKVTVEQAQAWARRKGAHERFINIAPIYWMYGESTGMNPEVLYAQAAKETGFGKYGGAVLPEMNNWAGIKVANPSGDATEDHESFATPEDGVRAHFNHLGIYCGVEPIGQVHPRYNITKTVGWAGEVKYIEDISGKWAPSPTYGVEIVKLILDMHGTK